MDSATMETGPVTVVVRRRVRPGKAAAYETWLAALIKEAATLPGYLGTNVQRPASGSKESGRNESGGNESRGIEYTSVFRFASVEHLRTFEESEFRLRALREVAELVEGDAVWEKLTGLELWFTPPAGTVVPQPSRFRMALVMICVVYGLVLSIGTLVAHVLSTAPMPLRLLVTITIEVFLMTYVLMPRLTRALARWIYPSRTEST